jgi:Zn-dependent protease
MLSGRNRELIRLFGFRITVDPLLPIVIILMAWVLADRYFPRYLMGIDTWVYVVMGIMSALLLSLSIFFHEFGHALMARKFKLPTERIHMFLFGGMAELKYRPIRPMHESLIALAGPVFSIILAISSYAAALLVEQFSMPTAHVFYYTALMNLLLAIFNVIPIFPLDGGRALRGILWQKTGRFYEASMLTFRISSNLIALLFIISFVSWFWFDPMWTLWIAAFALYMMYTALNGRRELVHIPTSDDLIFRLPSNEPTNRIIREIVEADPTYLSDCIVPVMNDGLFEGIIYGRMVEYAPFLEDSDLSYLHNEAVPGTYIDIESTISYEQHIEFLAEFVPVLRRGRLLGLCDPHELRFWLRETSRLRLETDHADITYYG